MRRAEACRVFAVCADKVAIVEHHRKRGVPSFYSEIDWAATYPRLCLCMARFKVKSSAALAC